MSELENSRKFWDSVATIYGGNRMTKNDADREMSRVFKSIGNNKIKYLIGLGVADGSRDPLMILDYLKDKQEELPHVIANDLSTDLVEECRKKLDEFDNLQADYFDGPMDQLTKDNIPFEDIKPQLIIGVYDINFLETALSLYKENKEIIGEEFTIFPLTFNDKEVKRQASLQTFQIDTYENVLTFLEYKYNTFKNSSSSFLGFTLITDKGFSSSYFYDKGLSNFLLNIFDQDFRFTVSRPNTRHLLCNIGNLEECNCIVTCLNNVLGNIPYDLQGPSLCKINEIFF